MMKHGFAQTRGTWSLEEFMAISGWTVSRFLVLHEMPDTMSFGFYDRNDRGCTPCIATSNLDECLAKLNLKGHTHLSPGWGVWPCHSITPGLGSPAKAN